MDPFARPLRPYEVDAEYEAAFAAEKKCYQEIRDAYRETMDLISLRAREEQSCDLFKSVFAQAEEKLKATAEEDTSVEVSEEKDDREVDYLTPFLPSGEAKTRAEAETARDECLKSLKERLLERANIIQRRLDEENSQLTKKRNAFQRSRDHVEGADEEFEAYCSSAMFRIQILEQRLERHEETALQKYADMDHKLRNDPRLVGFLASRGQPGTGKL